MEQKTTREKELEGVIRATVFTVIWLIIVCILLYSLSLSA